MMKTRNTLVLSLLALALILCTVISPTLAYFTDQDQATGAIPISLSGKTEIRDSYDELIKTVAIENTKGRDVWIRMVVAVGETYIDYGYVDITYGDGWTDGGDGYWYYGSPVSAGSATSNVIVDISKIPTKDLDPAWTEFNVAVLYETTPVQYKADGTTQPANWDIILDTSDTEGGEGNG